MRTVSSQTAIKAALSIAGKGIPPQSHFLPSEPAYPMDKSKSHLSDVKFVDAPISKESKAGLKHEFMTDVQAATLELGLSGVDLLVQAKTGTGKTVAFLLPAIERLHERPAPPNKISVLVVSPTRELALQIDAEAKGLLSHHKFEVQSVIGGTNIAKEQKRLQSTRCDVLVATPGRLLDHLQTGDMKSRLSNLQTVILDEADRLLDQGFKNELEKIFSHLPERKHVPRQCMLYSATLSKEIKQIASLYLHPNHKFVSTLKEGDTNTHKHVKQHYAIFPMANMLPASFAIINDDAKINKGSSKTVVFCTTARATAFAAEVAHVAGGKLMPPVYQIHSRMSQSLRMKNADAFKLANNAVLFSSDVTARGMDFPGVTLVLQMGLPSSAEQYIHRIGRTARAGAEGKGVILLSPPENFFLSKREMTELPITPYPDTLQLDELRLAIDGAAANVNDTTKAQVYVAYLGFYKAYCKPMKWTSPQLVQEANKYARDVLRWEDPNPPPILKKTVGMMNLKGVPGLNIVKPPPKV